MHAPTSLATEPISDEVIASASLPGELVQRMRAVGDRPWRTDGEFVLCWLHHAVRGHENPVIDAALQLGAAMGTPVLVYQGLGGRHRFNSDRHHTFILEGARDLQRELRERGIAYALSVPTETETPSPLRRLLPRACAFLTEDYPAPPFPRWTARLADRAPCATYVVDAACLMPIRALNQRHTRAFKFRDAAKHHWRGVMRDAWRDASADVRPMQADAATLGFEPVDPELAVTASVPGAEPPADASPWSWWRRNWFEHQALRDERAEVFTSWLPGGVREWSYVARATTPGRFVAGPPKAEEMYAPETFGRGATDVVVVE